MRNLPHPSFQYSGLTIILDKPSRFDSKQLYSGRAGEYFEECLLAGGQPSIHRASVEIRTLASINEPLLPGTKTLLLLGPDTVGRYLAGVSLDEQRGSPFKFGDYTCIASYSPQDSYDRRDYFGADEEEDDESKDTDASAEKTTHGRTQRKNWRFWMRQDIRKAIRLTVEGLNVPTCNYHYWSDIEEILQLLTTTKGVNFYFDIETDKHLQITCFGFSLDEGKNVYVVPMLQTQLNPQIYFYNDTHKILRALAICLRDNTVVIHNSMFDLFVLAYRYGIPLVGKVYDTMLAHNRCYIEVEKSLGHVISLHTDLPYHKNEGIFEPHTQAQTQQLYEYNGKDVFALTQIKAGIDKTATRIKATESIEQVNRAILPYLTATLQGMKLDEKKIAYFTDYYRRYNEQIRRILHFVTGGQDFNPNSWQQVSRYLYGDDETTKGLGIPKPTKDPTNEKTLLELLLKHDIPAIHAILRFRGNQKRISKAGLKTKKGEPRYWWGARFDKPSAAPRLTTAWILSGTTTMRLGSRKLLRRWGDNVQNWEKLLRKEVIPDEGKCFIQPDQSGAEALIVAYLCRPGQFRDIFLTGVNPHVYLAMHLFQQQFEAELGFKLTDFVQASVKEVASISRWAEVTKCIKASDDWEPSRRYYFIAKQGNHSLNYDAKARAFRLNTLLKSEGAVAMDLVTAQAVIDTRLKLFPEIPSWQQEIVAELWRTKLLRNLFGHPRLFTGHIQESMYKEAYAFKAQSTVGQITNYAFTELQERLDIGDEVLEKAGFDVLQNNHDSVLGQCWIDSKEIVGREMQKHMQRKLVSPRGEVFYMKSDVSWSPTSWGEMEPLKLN